MKDTVRISEVKLSQIDVMEALPLDYLSDDSRARVLSDGVLVPLNITLLGERVRIGVEFSVFEDIWEATAWCEQVLGEELCLKRVSTEHILDEPVIFQLDGHTAFSSGVNEENKRSVAATKSIGEEHVCYRVKNLEKSLAERLLSKNLLIDLNSQLKVFEGLFSGRHIDFATDKAYSLHLAATLGKIKHIADSISKTGSVSTIVFKPGYWAEREVKLDGFTLLKELSEKHPSTERPLEKGFNWVLNYAPDGGIVH